MTGTGTVFTGCIGVGMVVLTSAAYTTASDSAGDAVSRTLGPPAGLNVGDMMVACVSAGAYAGGGGPYTLTPDPAWTPVYEDPTSGTTNQIIPNIYTKLADADDAAGTSSYTWAVATATAAGIAVAHLGWGRQYGRTLSNPVAEHSLTPSIASPGGFWQLAFITQRTASAFGQPQPEPVVTSTATLLVPMFGTARTGAIRIYASDNVTPITGEYQVALDSPRQALVVAAVSA